MNITAFYQHLDGLFAAGQIEQVEPYLLTQMVMANQEHDADASLAIINELTGFYRSQQRFEEAIRVAEQALDLCSKEYRLGSLSHHTAQCRHSLPLRGPEPEGAGTVPAVPGHLRGETLSHG